MSEKMPIISGWELVKALEKIGYEQRRQRGSHMQLIKVLPDGSVSTFPVPLHGKTPVPKGTLRTILRQAGLTPEELRALL